VVRRTDGRVRRSHGARDPRIAAEGSLANEFFVTTGRKTVWLGEAGLHRDYPRAA
jgi:hypothetical protein